MDDDCFRRFHKINSDVQALVLKVDRLETEKVYMKEETARIAKAAETQAATVTTMQTQMTVWTAEQKGATQTNAKIVGGLVIAIPILIELVKHYWK